MAPEPRTCNITRMRIFWHEGGLHVHPESEHEGRMLVELVERLKFEKPPEMQSCIPGGETSSSSEGLFGSLAVNHELRPSSLPSERDHEQHVISIRKPL